MDQITLEETGRSFLRRWGMEFEDLPQFAPKIGPDECLVLCSTITEGLANDASDIDLIYLGAGDLKGDVQIQMDISHQMDVAHNAAGREINVTRITPDELEIMAETLPASIALVEKPRILKGIKIERDPRRLMFAHRLRNGVPIVNPDVYAHWRERLWLDKYHIHICFQRVADYLNLQENVVGELEAGQVESAAWTAKTVMGPRLVMALLASIGVTNQSQRWHLRLLRRHQAEIGEELVERLVNFIWTPPPTSAAELTRSILDSCEPVLQDIYARHRQVHKAAYKFSYAVRYLPLKPVAAS